MWCQHMSRLNSLSLGLLAAYLELVNTLDSSLVLVSVPGGLLLSLSQPLLQLTQGSLPLRVSCCVLPSVLLYLLL